MHSLLLCGGESRGWRGGGCNKCWAVLIVGDYSAVRYNLLGSKILGSAEKGEGVWDCGYFTILVSFVLGVLMTCAATVLISDMASDMISDMVNDLNYY